MFVSLHHQLDNIDIRGYGRWLAGRADRPQANSMHDGMRGGRG